MSWSKKTYNNYLVASEEITTKEGSITFSSTVDFIRPGTDFQVILNSAATNLSTSAHVELQVSYDGTNFYKLVKGQYLMGTYDIDSTSYIRMWDVSSYGEFPYYRFKIAGGDGTASGGGSVTIKVIVPG